MAKLLHIDASPRGARSHSRTLSRAFVDAWLESHPGEDVAYRDVGRHPPPPVDETWIAAAFSAEDARTPRMRETLKLSDELIDELLAADILVLGMPMYNFGVPSSFKAYIDQIVRIGRTFDFEPDDETQPYRPRVHGKRIFIVVATGDSGYESNGRLEHLNHLAPYLRTVFGFIGITQLTFVHVGNDEFGGERLASALRRARTEILELAASASN